MSIVFIIKAQGGAEYHFSMSPFEFFDKIDCDTACEYLKKAIDAK